jgi:hypothetical protein
MALRDAEPIESPPGIAIASRALLTCLMDTLIAQGVISKSQAFNVIAAAQRQVEDMPRGSFYDEASLVLRNLLKRFPAR